MQAIKNMISNPNPNRQQKTNIISTQITNTNTLMDKIKMIDKKDNISSKIEEYKKSIKIKGYSKSIDTNIPLNTLSNVGNIGKNNRNQRYSPRSNKGQKEVPRGPQQNNHPNQRQNPSRTEKSKPNPKSNDGQRSSQMEFQPMRGGMMRGGFRGGRGVARGPENMQRDTQRRSPIPREVNSGQFRGGDRGRFANMLLL